MPSTTTTTFSSAEELAKELKLSANMTPFQVPSSPLFVPVNAYLVPLLVLCTFVINAMVCIVLFKPHIRSTTNTILTAMAVADTLTGLSPLPCYLYFYTRGHYREWVPFNWCYIYFCLTDFLPSIFHTASIWLTVALAVQRYISVCHTETARWLCTIRKAVLAAVCLLMVATLSQVGRFVEMDYHPVIYKSRLASEQLMVLNGEGIEELVESSTTTDSVKQKNEFSKFVDVQESVYSEHITGALSSWPIADALDYKDDYVGYTSDSYSERGDGNRIGHADKNDSDSYIVGCSYSVTNALKPHQHVYFNAYYLFRILFIHIIPCLTLIVINGLLLKTMREGQNRRTRLLKMNRLTESRRLAEVNRTTLMLVVVVALFLIVEVPSACLFVVVVLENSFELALLTSEAGAEAATTVINLVILLSYPMNFFIYCAMSTQFRSGFIHLFKRHTDTNHQQRRKNCSAKNGSNAAKNCFKSSLELPLSKEKQLREAGASSIPSSRRIDEV